jgi:hypothetical protein
MTERAVQRRSILAPLPIDFPLGASSLYAILVPHHNPYHVDWWMVAKSGLFTLDYSPPKSGMWWRHDPNCRELQQWLDFLSLSHTCKHAHKYLQLHADEFDDILEDLWLKVMPGVFFRASGKKQKNMITMERLPQLQRTLACAALDRTALARWFMPPGTRMDVDAINDLFRHRNLVIPPLGREILVQGHWPPECNDDVYQRRLWLALVVVLRPLHGARVFVRLAGEDPIVLAWLDLKCLADDRFKIAKIVCKEVYKKHGMNKGKRYKAIGHALGLFDVRTKEAAKAAEMAKTAPRPLVPSQ